MSVANVLRAIFERLQEIERRSAGAQWTGKVKQVDAEKHTIRMVLGKDEDGNEVLSPWLPVSQVAGKLKIHSMPSVGQVVTGRAEGGDLEQAVIDPYHWTDENPSPSNDEDEHVLTLGSVRVTLTDGGIKAEVGGTSVELTGGELKMHSDTIAATGTTMTHNSKRIDSQHRHKDVMAGPDTTGFPE